MQITIDNTPVWITYFSESECEERNQMEGLRETSGDHIYTAGYYWAVCSPGCIPDSEFYGPFTSETAAESDATEVLNW